MRGSGFPRADESDDAASCSDSDEPNERETTTRMMAIRIRIFVKSASPVHA
jgi:hypothetical protein